VHNVCYRNTHVFREGGNVFREGGNVFREDAMFLGNRSVYKGKILTQESVFSFAHITACASELRIGLALLCYVIIVFLFNCLLLNDGVLLFPPKNPTYVTSLVKEKSR
jgi:hypothetical protein